MKYMRMDVDKLVNLINYNFMAETRLDRISIKGFKSIASVENLELTPINVVIGPNGSGKSNFIGTFAFLNAVREGRLGEYVIKAGGADQILHFGSKSTKEINMHVSFGNEVNQYKLKLEATDTDELFPAGENVFFWDKKKYPHPYDESLSRNQKEAGISNDKPVRIAKFVRQHLGGWRVYHFHDTSSLSPMKKTTDINDNRFLRSDGANLAAFLNLLKQRHSLSYELIRKIIQKVTPFFDDFQLLPTQLNPDKIRIEWRHKNFDKYFDASSLSDGTLRFMALATLFLQPSELRPSIILIDEPELGLHPYAITMVAEMIKSVSHENQVIVSTQSPFLLDHFAPEDVLVAEREDGGTKLRRLDSESLASWMEDFSLGQLWEKNELGGRPKND